jgi:hypothetical protein
MTKRIIAPLALVLLFLAAALPACSKGDDDDDSGGQPAVGSIDFAAEGPGAAGDIWLELGEKDVAKQTFTLKVIGDGLTAFGVAGRLIFDVSVCELTGITVGDALEGGTAELVGAAAGNDKGGVFGVSRSVDWQHSAAVSKDKVVGTLKFSVKKAGTTTIAFNADRSRALDEGLHSVEVANWLGGELTVK